MKRRSFLRNTGLTGAGLFVGFSLTQCKVDEVPGIINLLKTNIDNEAIGLALNNYLNIDPSGLITIMAHKPEMGQGTFHSIPLILAEELDVDPDGISIKIAKGDEERYGPQGVGGSGSVRDMWMPLRNLGASARHMLRQAAANTWGIDIKDTSTDNGFVIGKEGVKLSYGDLVEKAKDIEVPETIELKAISEFKYIGKSKKRTDINSKVNGSANFGIDMRVEGMVYASIVHCPGWKGTVKSIDDADTRKIAGVTDVVKTVRPLFKNTQEAVAVIADTYWAALQGARALKVSWEDNKHAISTEDIFKTMHSKTKEDGMLDKENGQFETAFAKSDTPFEATYETPFLSHSPIEPMGCLADVKGDKAEVWATTQTPGWCKGEMAKMLEIKPENITINIPFLGGAFGRRLIHGPILQACDLSKKIGKPVRVLWTREEDTMNGPFRPGSVNALRGTLSAEGKIDSLEHKVVTPSIGHALFGRDASTKVPGSAMAPLHEYYTIPNYRSKYVFMDVDPMPLLWWRSVYSSTNVFAHESFIDELAVAAKKDPMDFRLDLLEDDERKHKLLKTLRQRSDWDKALPEGWGKGVAISHCFQATAAHVVYISKTGTGVKIEKIHTAVDCGIAVNENNIIAQAEGCIVMGLTAAYKDAMIVKDGVTQNSNFHNYRMLRINEIPELDIFVMKNEESPVGAGEPGLPPVAPALTNAIFNLTGNRIRKLPFELDKVGVIG